MKVLGALFATVIGGWFLFNLVGALIVGLIARAIFPARDKVGWPMTIVLGFVGGIVGKLAFWALHWPTSFPMGFVASVLGAFLLLLVHHLRTSLRTAGAR